MVRKRHSKTLVPVSSVLDEADEIFEGMELCKCNYINKRLLFCEKYVVTLQEVCATIYCKVMVYTCHV